MESLDCSDLCHSWQQCSKSLCIITSMLWYPWCLLLCLPPAWQWIPCPSLQVVPQWFCMVSTPCCPHRRTQLFHKPLPQSCTTGNSQPLTATICCILVVTLPSSDPQSRLYCHKSLFIMWIVFAYCMFKNHFRGTNGCGLPWSVWKVRFQFSWLWHNIAEDGRQSVSLKLWFLSPR